MVWFTRFFQGQSSHPRTCCAWVDTNTKIYSTFLEAFFACQFLDQKVVKPEKSNSVAKHFYKITTFRFLRPSPWVLLEKMGVSSVLTEVFCYKKWWSMFSSLPTFRDIWGGGGSDAFTLAVVSFPWRSQETLCVLATDIHKDRKQVKRETANTSLRSGKAQQPRYRCGQVDSSGNPSLIGSTLAAPKNK